MENITRSSLDHTLLAMDQLEKGDVARAQVHATIASALAPREWDERTVLRWERDLKALEQRTVIAHDAGEPSGVAVPGHRISGRERAMARRGLQSDS